MESLYQPFFDKFQKELLSIANSDAGRALFQIPGKERVVKLSPNSYHVQKDTNLFEAVFRCYDLYSSIVTGGLPTKKIKPAEEMLPFIARKNHSMQPFFHLPMASLNTYYSGAGDGWIYASGSPGSYDTQQAAASGTVLDYTSATGYAMITQDNGGGAFNCRSFFPVNTASLTNGVKVVAPTKFSAYGFANYSDTDGKGVNVIKASQASTSILSLSDYSLITKTLLCDTVILLHLTNGAYNDWAFNAAGLAYVNRTGYTKLALAGNTDYTNSSTSGPACGHSIYFSEQSGTDKDPKFTVYYSYFGGAIL